MAALLQDAGAAFRWLADLNAALNATSFVLICAGLFAIRRGRETLHKRLMLAATAVSAAFLISYVVYHLNAEPVRYGGQGAGRLLYLAILGSHVVLAAAVVPLVVLTVRAGLRDQRPRHRRLARVTAPIWLYVSITGVIVYVMLYRT
jgi:putative membrane protein